MFAEGTHIPPTQPPVAPPPMSTLSTWSSSDLARSLSSSTKCPEQVRLLAVGTHPTLTMEAVGMLRKYAFASEQPVTLVKTLGITYKCAVFPDMCAGSTDGGSDPVADLIGPFDAPPADHLYTLARISEKLQET